MEALQPTTLQAKADVLRKQLAIDAGLTVAETIEQAVRDTNLESEVEGLTLAAMADKCLSEVLPRTAARPIAASSMSIVIGQPTQPIVPQQPAQPVMSQLPAQPVMPQQPAQPVMSQQPAQPVVLLGETRGREVPREVRGTPKKKSGRRMLLVCLALMAVVMAVGGTVAVILAPVLERAHHSAMCRAHPGKCDGDGDVGGGEGGGDGGGGEGGGAGNGAYVLLPGPFSFVGAVDACYQEDMVLASFKTPAEATAAGAATTTPSWIAAWRDMDAQTWGWYGYVGGVECARAEWHVFDGPRGCYMEDSAECNPSEHSYAEDCYACSNIDSESSRHGFVFSGDGYMDMGTVDELHAALCKTTC